ncbi:MAG TPA: HAD family hydrolase [Planctomycetota bacterium]|nr:HAD family hydrolase [Planctomycetota bacterium]
MTTKPLRIAMWSGPRNLSTAMMRSFGNRADTFVTDEPLYAHYLKATGLAHPGADEVIEVCDTDWQRVVAWLTGPVPQGKSVWYQKHMTHHLLPEIARGWLEGLKNAFLLRDPRDVVPSLDAKFSRPTLADTGMAQQLEIFELVRQRTGRVPPVVDAADLLRNPEVVLRALCAALDLEFDPEMLHWPAGRRTTDGVWAKHWYHSVERSTGFAALTTRRGELSEHLVALCEECMPYYEALHAHRLRT